MNGVPGWWQKRRDAARVKKVARKAALRAEWSSLPRSKTALGGALKPYVPDPNPTSWYQFCTDLKYAYEARGDNVAAMFYWSLRSFDLGDSPDPCTDEGYQELCGYWSYKMDWLEGRQIS